MKRVLIVTALVCAPVFAQEVILPTYSATTPSLATLAAQAALEPTLPTVPRLQPEHTRTLPTLAPSTTPDPLTQIGTGSTFKPLAGLNFMGNGHTFPGFTIVGEPPDTNGAVGTTQYVQWVNSSYTVFNKITGTAILGPINGNVLFNALPAASICRTTNSGDIIANFDKINSRWVLTQFAITAETNGQYGQCIAVSTTADATGTYNVYQYNFPDFDDYPKIGIWSDAYYISYNMFSHTDGSFLNAKICAYNSPQMRAGAATPAAVCFNTAAGDDFSLMPSDIDGLTLPPAGSPNPVWELYNNGILRLFNFHVDFVTTGNSTLSAPTTLNVAPFTFVCNNFTGGSFTCVNQPGTPQQLDTLGDRMMYRAAYRNRSGVESVMLSHSVDATPGTSDLSGVRWYEMRITGNPYAASVYQSATQAPATGEHRWMSSIAMDKAGNVLLGYSVSNGTATFPSIRVTGRTRTEPRNFMETETTLWTGTGSQTGHSRWGDYSGMTVDPVDDCTFWYTQEYFDAPNADFAWKTRIASFKFPSCQ
jgi:hypothetical protein